MILLPVLAQAAGIKINGIYYRFDSSTRTATVTNSGGTPLSSYPNSYTTSSVTIPETVYYNGITYDVTRIDGYAFYQCTNSYDFTIPNSVTSIGAYAFSGCTTLYEIEIPNSVTEIGSFAFQSCSNLTKITIPNSVTYIGTLAFDGTYWYNNKPDGLVYA